MVIKKAAKYIDLLLSFFLPVLILGLAYYTHDIYPFGPKTVLICDLNGQYVDFYSSFQEMIRQGKSMLYSWQAGMGLNFCGLFAYYLSSPFSFIVLLFKKQNLPEALLLMTLLKAGSAGLSFSIFARYFRNNTKPAVLIFSLLYALMGYSIVYSFNLMFLDGVIFLPLVILGVEKILREDRYFFFIISLAIIIIANFYIAYMIGLFSLLYFLTRFFSVYTSQEFKLFRQKLSLYFRSAAFAVGLSAIIWLPTFFALTYTQGSPDFPIKWSINFKLFDLAAKLQLGSYDTLKLSGLPNIYCGLLPLLLLPLFFWDGRVKYREKIVYSASLVFLIASFLFSNLDLAWHAFDEPDWFLYRYSFVFSFLIITSAYREFNRIQAVDTRKLSKVFFVWLVILILLQKFHYTYLSDKLLIISMFLFALYSLIIYLLVKAPDKRKAALVFLVILVALEASLNSWYLLRRLDGEFAYTTREKYAGTLEELESVIPLIREKDQGFYRLDRVGGRTFNDPMNLNYNGLTHFSSMANAPLHQFLHKLGFLSTAQYKSVNFAGSTPISSSILGIKYVISAQEMGLGYREVISSKDYNVYENTYALPLGFLASRQLKALDYSVENPFQVQRDFINLAQGRDKTGFEYFNPLKVTNVELNNVFITKENNMEVFQRINSTLEASVEFTIDNPADQQIFASFHAINSYVEIYLNGIKMDGYYPVYNKRIVDLGFHRKNKPLKFKLVFNNDGFSLKHRYFFGLTEENLSKALLPFRESLFEVNTVTDRSVKGTVKAGKDQLLFTSIPYDPGWQAFIDGNRTPIIKIGGSLIALELTEGRYEIEFVFEPRGLRSGILISVSTLILLLLFRTVFRGKK